MKFVISRASDHKEENSPCEGAYEQEIPKIDIRSISKPEEFNIKSMRESWYKEGTNHRLINGKIARDMGTKKVWCIDFESMDDLIKFTYEFGDVIIGCSDYDNGMPNIQIYDDYIE